MPGPRKGEREREGNGERERQRAVRPKGEKGKGRLTLGAASTFLHVTCVHLKLEGKAELLFILCQSKSTSQYTMHVR